MLFCMFPEMIILFGMSGSVQDLERDKVKERDAVVLRLEAKIEELQKVAGLPKKSRLFMRVLKGSRSQAERAPHTERSQLGVAEKLAMARP